MSPMLIDFSNLRQVLLQAVIIVCFGIGTGLMFNYPLLMRVFEGQAPHAPRSVTAPYDIGEPQIVVLEDFEALPQGVVLVDARIPELYAEGRLPGAVSLPLAEFEQHFPAFAERVAADAPLIVYCSGYSCPDSFDLAVRLQQQGYGDIRVFEGGYPQWRDAGRPIEKGAP